MSVIFHIATGREWERAISSGTYTTESVHSHGVVVCLSPEQHAAAANRLFAGRTDLVLLLIDTDRIESEVRVEQADAHGRPVPCVYGPVNLEAVFEATPYRSGADGRFHPHEEASGLAVRGAATLDQTRRRAVEVMAGYRRPWWVAGGWALDLLRGYKTRPHADLEISILACDQQALFAHLRGWDLRLAAPGQGLPRWGGSPIESPFHQVWARRGPGRPSTSEEFAADPTMLGFLLEQSRTDRWVFRRHAGVSRPLRQVGVITTDGVPVVAPEIALLFKAKAPRFKDQRDFDRVLPHLDRAARSWLASALEQAYPGHPWHARVLEATVALHAERGLVATQVTDIAQRARVDRVTVYRHFPDPASLLKACAAHYYQAHPPPDPTGWAAIGNPEARLRHGLGEVYGYWAANAAMAANVLRDAPVLGHLGVGRRLLGLQRDATQVLASGWPSTDQQPALAATIGVAVDFYTWQRLVAEQGLSQQQAVELAVSWTRCLASPR